MAHDDIEPSEEWADKILEELKECDVFMPILTKEFNESKYTDQETGCALILKKVIMPLKVDVDPHGFISRYQARTLRENDVGKSIAVIMRVISGKPRVGALLKDAAIMKFAKSENFEDARNNTERLVSLKGFSLNQVKEIMKHTIRNNQIHQCYKAQNMLKEIIEGYKDKIDPRIYKKVRSLIS